MLDKDVITMSFAPKDEHDAQIQFALERGIPATLSVIGTQRLPFADNAYDLIHCARCRVHWDANGMSYNYFIIFNFFFYITLSQAYCNVVWMETVGGKPLMELNRIVRPGGFFIWSATPVYRRDTRDKKVWKCK